MKAQKIYDEKEFKPFTLQIRIESIEDFILLKKIIGTSKYEDIHENVNMELDILNKNTLSLEQTTEKMSTIYDTLVKKG